MTISEVERKRLKALRKKAKLTQPQLAKLVGTTQSTIHNMEKGRYNQLFKAIYAKILRTLEDTSDRDAVENTDTAESTGVEEFRLIYRKIVDDLDKLSAEDLRTVAKIVSSLKPRTEDEAETN